MFIYLVYQVYLDSIASVHVGVLRGDTGGTPGSRGTSSRILCDGVYASGLGVE